MKKKVSMILIMIFIVTGCGKVDEKSITKSTEKKEKLWWWMKRKTKKTQRTVERKL